MPDFMDTIETMRADEASTDRLTRTERGERRAGRSNGDQRYKQALLEAARLIERVSRGDRRAILTLEEAMTTSDFPNLFADVLDRQMLGRYREFPQSYRDWVHVTTVRDFRKVRRFTLDGGEGRLQKIGVVPEETNYQYEALTDGKYEYSVSKYGKKYKFSWEDFINDDLEAFNDLPDRMGRSARRTEEYFATDLFFDANGPDATFFASANKNIVTSNPVLSIAALQTAMQIFAAQVDADGEPIAVDGMTLVIPPALEVTAQNILNATELWATAGTAGGATGQELHVVNWMRSKLKLAVAPYIPIVASSSNGNTSWLIVATPDSGRPAAEMGFLRSEPDPALFQQHPNASRAGGGDAGPFDGSFEDDSVAFKVRHVMGGVLMDPKMAVGSNGSGS